MRTWAQPLFFKDKAFQTLEAVSDTLQGVIQRLERELIKSIVNRQWPRMLFENRQGSGFHPPFQQAQNLDKQLMNEYCVCFTLIPQSFSFIQSENQKANYLQTAQNPALRLCIRLTKSVIKPYLKLANNTDEISNRFTVRRR